MPLGPQIEAFAMAASLATGAGLAFHAAILLTRLARPWRGATTTSLWKAMRITGLGKASPGKLDLPLVILAACALVASTAVATGLIILSLFGMRAALGDAPFALPVHEMVDLLSFDRLPSPAGEWASLAARFMQSQLTVLCGHYLARLATRTQASLARGGTPLGMAFAQEMANLSGAAYAEKERSALAGQLAANLDDVPKSQPPRL